MARGQRSEGEPAADTATRLLDAAERLFGRLGYDGVGMRALADEAGTNLGAATYHFGSKENLYLETFLRRFRTVAAEQARALAEAEAAAGGRPLEVATIVRCMAGPPYRMMRTHPDFAGLLARNLYLPPPFMAEALQREHPPTLEPFIRALRQALPDLPEATLWRRISFAGGVLHLHLPVGPRSMPPAHPDAGRSADTVFEDMLRFMTAGLSAPATEERPSTPRRRTPGRR